MLEAEFVMTTDEILSELQTYANPNNVAGMARFGINPDKTLGVSIPTLRSMAKKIGENHALAQDLWKSAIHEARILASMVDDPKSVTEMQMEQWVADFDSWDVCDQVCMNLFGNIVCAYEKAIAWSKRKQEFEKRAGFALMAVLACHDKTAPDRKFQQFFPIIQREAADERNYVKKAVNWALRQIGKRNTALLHHALACAHDVEKIDSKSARWIASDALRELTKRL